MDIYCPTCHEPWDHHHLLHDASHETNLPTDLCNASDMHRMFNYMLEAMQGEGWKFSGESVLSFIRCPCCPKDSPTVDDSRYVIIEINGDDIDATVSDLNEFTAPR